jgi:hypothetical protein
LEKFSLPSWSTRNPLGIVALFISLIYGMSAILLGASIKELSPHNQTILVLFIAIFPFVVLAVFGWLVARHHMKLYGPSDYRTDKSFLDAFGNLEPSEVKKRLENEVEREESATAPPSGSGDNPPSTWINLAGGTGKSRRLTEMFVVESLVFQSLQRDFKGTIRRGVRLGNMEIDGLILPPDGGPIIVEIKIVRGWVKNPKDTFYQIGRFVESARLAWKGHFDTPPRFVVVIVVEGGQESADRFEKLTEIEKDRFGADVDLRVYSLPAMLKEYGILAE